MRIGQKDDTRVIVTVKTAKRDNVKTSKTFGKVLYETFESIDVFEASPEDVTKGVVAGLQAAARSAK